MPTGYTATIADGITFEEYAWNCARAFGALVMMRDEPVGATIPEFEEPSYHIERLNEIKNKITQLAKLADDPKLCDQEAKKEYDEAVKYYKKSHKEKTRLLAKYNAMLEQVRKFVPPSEDHIALKEFMEEQINDSIKYDCNFDYDHSPVLLSGKEWLARELKSAESNLKYYTKEYEKEMERVRDRNLWVKQLRDTIGPQPKSKK